MFVCSSYYHIFFNVDREREEPHLQPVQNQVVVNQSPQAQVLDDGRVLEQERQ